MHADHLEDKIVNLFYKIKKHKKWIKAIKNKFKVMHSNSSESNVCDGT